MKVKIKNPTKSKALPDFQEYRGSAAERVGSFFLHLGTKSSLGGFFQSRRRGGRAVAPSLRTLVVAGGILLSADSSLAEENASERDFVLESFPLASEMWIAPVRVDLKPVESRIFYSKAAGELQVLAENGCEVRQDQVWAVSDLERTRLDQESLELERAALEESLKNLERSHEDELVQLDKKLATLAVERGRLEVLLESEEVSGDDKLRSLVLEGLATSDAERDRQALRQEDLRSRRAIDGERSRLRLDFRKRELELERVQKSTEYRAPFRGQLTFLGTPADRAKSAPTTVEVEASEPLAALQNDSHYEVVLATQTPALAEVPKSSLFLVIDRIREELKIRAAFERVDVNPQDVLLRESLVFAVDDADVEKARKRTSGQSLAAVFTQLEEPCHLVPKTELIQRLPEGEDVVSWSRLISRFWPGALVIAEVQSVLAISQRKL